MAELKLKGELIICEFTNYPAEKKKLFAKYPNAIPIEEIKTIFLQPTELPPGLIQRSAHDRASKAMIPMITYAVIFQLPEEPEKKKIVN